MIKLLLFLFLQDACFTALWVISLLCFVRIESAFLRNNRFNESELLNSRIYWRSFVQVAALLERPPSSSTKPRSTSMLECSHDIIIFFLLIFAFTGNGYKSWIFKNRNQQLRYNLWQWYFIFSGVAVLSCTDCSGSSTASSDITDPGSPFSTASNHSEDSASQQPSKMPPTQTAHHPPWPWTPDECAGINKRSVQLEKTAFPKRIKSNEDTSSKKYVA